MTKTLGRFYKKADRRPVDGGFAVLLDDRPVKTPKTRRDLTVPSDRLAAAIADEWAAQSETVDPATMPFTALASTAHDLEDHRTELVTEIARHAETDTLCYWAPEPAELRRRQHVTWQPLLDWIALTYDARLNVTTGVLPIDQPSEAIRASHEAVDKLDTFRLAALSSAVKASSSLVIGFALLEKVLNGDQAFDAAEVEASFQIEQWGLDAEAEARRKQVYADLVAAADFRDLL